MTLSKLLTKTWLRMKQAALEAEVDILRWGLQRTRERMRDTKTALRETRQRNVPPPDLELLEEEMQTMAVVLGRGCGNPNCANCQRAAVIASLN